MSAPGRVLSIDHVQLAMPKGSEDRARNFYRDVLGMTEIPKPEPLAERGGCWFGSGKRKYIWALKKIFVPRKKRILPWVSRDWTTFSRDAKRRGLLQSRTRKSMGAAAFTCSIRLVIAWS